MKSGIQYKQRDVVLIPFPFTDLASLKQRPALVISSNEYNKKTEDFVVCGITSNLKDEDFSIILSNKELSEGSIPIISRIKADKIFTLKQSLVRKKIAAVKTQILQKTLKEVNKVFGKNFIYTIT